MAETFELTPEQWTRLMDRLGNNYGAYDNLMAYNGMGYMYSRTFIVRGENEAEVMANGTRAVATSGQGSLADVQVRYVQGAQSPTSFSVTTSDPTIIREIQAIDTHETFSAALRRMAEAMRQMMSPPDNRRRQMMEVLDEMQAHEREHGGRNGGAADQMMRRMMENSRGQPTESTGSPTSGRDRILSDVAASLAGTAFSVPSGTALSLRDQQARSIDPGIVRDSGPDTAVPMPQMRGPSTGFMRYMEPDGTSSVYSGDRRLYTDIPVFERNAFGGGDRAVGTLRIYGELDRPERHQIITDNPALRSAAERAGIPLVPATMPPSQERERAGPRS